MSYEEEKQDRKIERLEAEIERLRASLTDLHAEYINTLEKNPECSAWDLDEQSIEDQRRLRRNAAHAISIVEPPIYLQADQQATKILELEAISRRRNEIINKQVAKIKELKADLEQSEEIKRLKDELENYGDHYACLLISKDAQIKELEGMLSIRTEELDIAHSAARSEKEMHEKELAAFARRIKELEDALVEAKAEHNYGPQWKWTGAEKLKDDYRRSARDQLIAEGRIGNSEHFTGVSKMIWQITDERIEAFGWILHRLEYDQSLPGHTNYKIQRAMELLRAMLHEAGQ